LYYVMRVFFILNLRRAAQVRYYPDTYHGFAVRGDARNPGMEGAKEEVQAP